MCRAKNWNILFPDLSFVFFRTSFVYLLILEGPLKSYLGTLDFFWWLSIFMVTKLDTCGYTRGDLHTLYMPVSFLFILVSASDPHSTCLLLFRLMLMLHHWCMLLYSLYQRLQVLLYLLKNFMTNLMTPPASVTSVALIVNYSLTSPCIFRCIIMLWLYNCRY